MQDTPFYVFSESYGGKMAAAYGVALHKGPPEFLFLVATCVHVYGLDSSHMIKRQTPFLQSPALQAGKLKCNFKGVVLGDSWISPIDYVMSWAPYLYATSLIDDEGFDRINNAALATKKVRCGADNAHDHRCMVDKTLGTSEIISRQTLVQVRQYICNFKMRPRISIKGSVLPSVRR